MAKLVKNIYIYNTHIYSISVYVRIYMCVVYVYILYQLSHQGNPLYIYMYIYVYFVTLCTVAHQASLSMGFSRQEYWGGLPCPPLGDLPDPGIEHISPVTPALQVDSLPLSHWGSPYTYVYTCVCIHTHIYTLSIYS